MTTFPNDQALSYARHVIRDILVDPDASRLNDVHLAALGQAMLAAALPVVLRAIREPTERMARSGLGHHYGSEDSTFEEDRTNCIHIYQAMIDTALKEIEG